MSRQTNMMDYMESTKSEEPVVEDGWTVWKRGGDDAPCRKTKAAAIKRKAKLAQQRLKKRAKNATPNWTKPRITDKDIEIVCAAVSNYLREQNQKVIEKHRTTFPANNPAFLEKRRRERYAEIQRVCKAAADKRYENKVFFLEKCIAERYVEMDRVCQKAAKKRMTRSFQCKMDLVRTCVAKQAEKIQKTTSTKPAVKVNPLASAGEVGWLARMAKHAARERVRKERSHQAFTLQLGMARTKYQLHKARSHMSFLKQLRALKKRCDEAVRKAKAELQIFAEVHAERSSEECRTMIRTVKAKHFIKKARSRVVFKKQLRAAKQAYADKIQSAKAQYFVQYYLQMGREMKLHEEALAKEDIRRERSSWECRNQMRCARNKFALHKARSHTTFLKILRALKKRCDVQKLLDEVHAERSSTECRKQIRWAKAKQANKKVKSRSTFKTQLRRAKTKYDTHQARSHITFTEQLLAMYAKYVKCLRAEVHAERSSEETRKQTRRARTKYALQLARSCKTFQKQLRAMKKRCDEQKLFAEVHAERSSAQCRNQIRRAKAKHAIHKVRSHATCRTQIRRTKSKYAIHKARSHSTFQKQLAERSQWTIVNPAPSDYIVSETTDDFVEVTPVQKDFDESEWVVPTEESKTAEEEETTAKTGWFSKFW